MPGHDDRVTVETASVAAEEAALALAVAAGVPRLADELRARLERYRNREPFVDRRAVSPRGK